MVKATKAKISDKTLDVLQKTKRAPSTGASSSKRGNEDQRSSRSRSRSMSRTPARPPPSKTKKAAKKPSKTPESDSKPSSSSTKGKGKGTGKAASKETKPKAPAKKKAAPKKTAPKRVGKEPESKPRKRAGTPKKERVRQTPTRQSKRISSVYNSIPSPSNSIDTLDSPPKGRSNHFDNKKNADTQSLASNSSRRGWFSNCVIV